MAQAAARDRVTDAAGDMAHDAAPTGRPPHRRVRWPAAVRGPFGEGWLRGALVGQLLTGYIVTVYVTVLGLGGVDTDTSGVPWWLNAISLPIIVLTVRPVRNWLRRGVDGVFDGQHDDPYTVLTAVHQQAEADPDPGAMVPAIADAIAATLRLPHVVIETTLGEAPLTAASGAPVAGAEIVTVPLTYHGAAVGSLRASGRRPNEPLTAVDRRLLADLARQVGITLHAAQLTAALGASRQQIVTAREEERRRIRRDLHDGLGPTLASMRLQLGALRRTIPDANTEAAALIDSLRGDVQTATADIRRLVYDLRPPMLDEFGLAGALRNLGAIDAIVARRIEAPDTLPPLPAAVEVAIYRIAAEALTNIDRHAGASTCTVRLDVSDDAVTLTVADDGVGIGDAPGVGVGCASMRERAAEIGGTLAWTAGPDGGTIVRATIPRREVP